MRAGVLLLLLATAVPLAAHPLAPALLELREGDAGRADVEWRVPALRRPGPTPTPTLPARCRDVTPRDTTLDGMAVHTRWTVDCGDALGPGDAIGVRDVDPSGAVVRVVWRDGSTAERLVLSDEPTFVIPPTPHGWEAMAAYARLGIQHILSGPDHLLFVFGLVLLSGTLRRIAATVTAFTIGHSLTLAAAVLGFVHVWQPGIEAAIAASVFALAVELARDPAQPTAMRRYPWVMAGLFGLLHGLGFATVLTEAGLSHADLPRALLAFNVGIEIGQLMFVEAVLVFWWLVERIPVAFPAWTRAVPLYAMGTLAAYWWLERTAAMLR